MQAKDPQALALLEIPTDALAISGRRKPAENPAIVYAETHGHTAKSRATVYETLRRIARTLDLPAGWESIPWARFGAREASLLIRRAEDLRYAPRTTRLMVAVWRGVMQMALDLEQITADEHARAIRFPRVVGKSDTAGRSLTRLETDRLWEFCTSKPTPYGGFLEAMMFGAMLGAGLRRAEVASLDLAAREGGVLRVFGKGQKVRRVPLPEFSRRTLERWEAIRAGLPCTVDRLFPCLNALGRAVDAPLSPWAVWDIVARALDGCGIVDAAPHDFRRTYATRLLAAGVDMPTVQRLMGHASLTTTAIYDRRGEDIAADLFACSTTRSKQVGLA